jgi:hypothetical protein
MFLLPDRFVRIDENCSEFIPASFPSLVRLVVDARELTITYFSLPLVCLQEQTQWTLLSSEGSVRQSRKFYNWDDLVAVASAFSHYISSLPFGDYLKIPAFSCFADFPPYLPPTSLTHICSTYWISETSYDEYSLNVTARGDEVLFVDSREPESTSTRRFQSPCAALKFASSLINSFPASPSPFNVFLFDDRLD